MVGRQGYHLPNYIFTHITSTTLAIIRAIYGAFVCSRASIGRRAGEDCEHGSPDFWQRRLQGPPLGFFFSRSLRRGGEWARWILWLARASGSVRWITTSHVWPSHSAASWCRRLPFPVGHWDSSLAQHWVRYGGALAAFTTASQPEYSSAPFLGILIRRLRPVSAR
jgi:hypothetical protein